MAGAYTINRQPSPSSSTARRATRTWIPSAPSYSAAHRPSSAAPRCSWASGPGCLRRGSRLNEKITPPFLWYQVEGNTRYAYLHHQGTRPHVITGALEFRTGARVTHARVVHHPGTKPNPYLRNALPAFMALRSAPSFRV